MKHILIAVTGSIAAYKAVDLVSKLSKNKNYDIEVIMTTAATKFIPPLTIESLLHKKVYLDPFESVDGSVNHVKLGKWADLMIMMPASANSIAKVVHGISDNMLTDTWLVCNSTKVICPAMNTQMYENPITQANLQKARDYGWHIIEPATGHLACGDDGKGKLESVDVILDEIEYLLSEKPLQNKKILVSAGPCQEALDPVRYLTNHSSGKQGYAIAKVASRLGADVTLVSGPVSIEAPRHVNLIPVKSANDMANAILSISQDQDIIIMAAAVADYRPKTISNQKIKKGDGELFIELERTTDILANLGLQKKPGQYLCGFAMETENLIENAKAKLEKKNCDLLVANSLNNTNGGFKSDTNIASILSKDGVRHLDVMSKEALAHEILMTLLEMEELSC